MWPLMRLSRMSDTSSCSTSASGMLSSLLMNGILMRVYGWISFSTTCRHHTHQPMCRQVLLVKARRMAAHYTQPYWTTVLYVSCNTAYRDLLTCVRMFFSRSSM